MIAAPGPAQRAPLPGVLPPRGPLPPWETAALRRTGTLCGALVGLGAGLGGGVALSALILAAFVVWLGALLAVVGLPTQPADWVSLLAPPWAIAALFVAVAAGLAALMIGWARLRHWPSGRAAGVTAAAAALAGIPAHALTLAIVPLALLLLGEDAERAHPIVVAVSAAAGAAVGALAGRYAWWWMGHAMRPRWWRPDASAHRGPLM